MVEFGRFEILADGRPKRFGAETGASTKACTSAEYQALTAQRALGGFPDGCGVRAMMARL